MPNLQFQNATFTSRVVIGKIQTAESVRISVKNDIRQVLSVGVESAVNSYDAENGEATFYGKTNIRFLYSDGTSLAGSTYNADFTASIADERITPDAKLTFDVITVDSKADANANTATLTILLEITVYGYISESSPYLAGGDDVFVKTDSLEVLQGVDVTNLTAVIDEELNATRNISSVLLAESSLCITDYSNAEGVLRIQGDAEVRLTYVSDDAVVTDALNFPFERELDSSSVMSDSQLKLTVFPKNTKVRLDISDGSTAFTVEITANIQAEATRIGVIDVVTDSYGEGCDFLFEKKTVSTTLPCGSATVRKKTSATLPSETGRTPITAVNVGAVVTKCVSGEKSATVDGIVYAALLYSAENGIDSEQLEIPFSQIVEVDYLAPQCQSRARATVSRFAVSDTNGLTVEAELCITIDAERQTQYQLITSAEEKPFDKRSLPAIEICLAHKGETLWNLAKNLHMSEESLVAVNPEITNPLDRDARIVVYNKP